MWKESVRHYFTITRNSDNQLILLFVNFFLIFPLLVAMITTANIGLIYFIALFPYISFVPIVLFFCWVEELDFSLSYLLTARKKFTRALITGLGPIAILSIYYIAGLLVVAYNSGFKFTFLIVVSLLIIIADIIVANTYFVLSVVKKYFLTNKRESLKNLIFLISLNIGTMILNSSIMDFLISIF